MRRPGFVLTAARSRPNCRRGYGQLGQLGHPGEVDHVVPKKVALLSKAKVTMLVSGPAAKSSAAVGADGKVYTFGCGRDGRLGHGSGLDAVNQDVPKAVAGIKVRLPEPRRARCSSLRCAGGRALCVGLFATRPPVGAEFVAHAEV